MAHPLLNTRTQRLISTAIMGAAIVLPATGAFALTGLESVTTPVECPAGTLVDDLTGLCETVVDAAQSTVEALPTELADPVLDALPTELIEDAVSEILPEPADAEPAPPAQDVAPSAGDNAPAPAATSPTEESQSVQAAGKAPTEVTEPAGPTADGRVATGPTIQPANLGVNIPGVRSESGLTLQPYEAPMVSIPSAFADAPQIAGVATTAAPAQAAAAELVSFAGSAIVPHTTGSAAWVTATGLGLLGGAAFATRRRLSTLNVTSLDD